MATPPADDEVRQLLVHPAVWPHLVAWLDVRGIELGLMPLGSDDLPTYVMTPRSLAPPTRNDYAYTCPSCSWRTKDVRYEQHACPGEPAEPAPSDPGSGT